MTTQMTMSRKLGRLFHPFVYPKVQPGRSPVANHEGLTEDEKESVRQAIMSELAIRPPTVGLIGVSGVGKSSTINTMFKANLAVSHTRACTKEFGDVRLCGTSGTIKDHAVSLIVRDAPGLGEDVRKDPQFLGMYERELPACDVVLWVMSARNRAVALDQMYLQHFMKRSRDVEALADLPGKLVFGVNQVDLVHPLNWRDGCPIPSIEQTPHIEDIVADRSKRLSDVLGRAVQVIPYSNVRGFNLEKLFTAMLASARPGRAWIFDSLRNFTLNDFLPQHLQHLTQGAN